MTGSGTALDPYIISDVDDLQAMENDLSAYYELGGDIDASATTGWSDVDGTGFIPLGEPGFDYFTGHFDGKGWTISNLFMKRTWGEVGLFCKTQGGTIQNVTLSDIDFTADSDGGGALVGYRVTSNTVITNCHASGSITAYGRNVGGLFGRVYSATITTCSSSCTITNDDDYVGGLIGYMVDGAVSDCYATGNITVTNVPTDLYVGGFIGEFDGGTIDQCYATGNAIGYGDVGGFVGYAYGGSITNCYAKGNATGTVWGVGGFAGGVYRDNCPVDNCYSTGTPTGGAYNGGFCGYNAGASITNCFWDTETSGTETSEGGTGKTTAEMKTQATFTDAGWDFTDIWGISSGQNNGYPYFQFSEELAGELVGVLSVIQSRLHYLDAYGVERYIEGVIVP